MIRNKSFFNKDTKSSILIEESKKIASLKEQMKNQLMPAHTLLYLAKKGFNNAAVLAVINDDLRALMPLLKDKNSNSGELQELMIIAAFCGSKQVIDLLKKDFHEHVHVNEEVLNMAILSGRYVDKDLEEFMQNTKPTYNSIPYAINSGKVEILRQILNSSKKFRLGPEHLLAAAGTGNIEVFNEISSRGVKPTGKMIYKIAEDFPEIREKLNEISGERNVTRPVP